MDSARVLELLRESAALLEGHFELSSGKHSDRYFQCARVLQHPAHARELARGLAQGLEALDVTVDTVVGVERIPSLVADILRHRSVDLTRRSYDPKGERAARKAAALVVLVTDPDTPGPDS